MLLSIKTPCSPLGAGAVVSESSIIPTAGLRLSQQTCRWVRGLVGALCVSALMTSPALQASETLSAPSLPSKLAQHNLLLDVTNAGARLVAVGEYGHILYSDDDGASWIQTQSPISSTLNAVYFVDAQNGWAVGHEGVVLATTDGGLSWEQQLNGLEINAIGLERAQQLLEQSAGSQMPDGVHPDLIAEDVEMLAMDAADFADEGASRPLFDVWFKNRLEGMVIGAYGIILHTTDGGVNWNTGFDQTYNIDNFHYYQIVPAATAQQPGGVFLVGEAGLLHRSLDGGISWQALESPYEGTFFGGLFDSASGELLAFGLRGNLFRSSDRGERWDKIDSQTTATLADGLVLNNGSFLLVGNGGVQLTIDPATYAIDKSISARRAPFSAVALSDAGNRVLTGFNGIELMASATATEKQEKSQ